MDWSDQPWSVLLPPAGDPLVISGFGEAVQLASEVVDLPVEREMLVLLDERRRVTAVLLDPPVEIGLFVGRCSFPGSEVEFCQTLSIVVRDRVDQGPPSDADRAGYLAARRAHMAQGLLLLDVIVTDGELARSLAIGCDPDPVWFDEFDPEAEAEGADAEGADAA